jgi:hypothetical protein
MSTALPAKGSVIDVDITTQLEGAFWQLWRETDRIFGMEEPNQVPP